MHSIFDVELGNGWLVEERLFETFYLRKKVAGITSSKLSLFTEGKNSLHRTKDVPPSSLKTTAALKTCINNISKTHKKSMNVAVVQEMWCSNVFAPKCGAYSRQELLKVNTM